MTLVLKKYMVKPSTLITTSSIINLDALIGRLLRLHKRYSNVTLIISFSFVIENFSKLNIYKGLENIKIVNVNKKASDLSITNKGVINYKYIRIVQEQHLNISPDGNLKKKEPVKK